MTKNYTLALLLFLTGIVNAQINFSDPFLKAQLLSANIYSIAMSENGAYITIDTNADGEISIEEASQIKALFLGGVNIASISGLEYFSNLRRLSVTQTSLTTASFQLFPQLESLTLSYNPLLTTLDISGSNVVWLDCPRNNLTSLNLSNHSMTYLDCSNNHLTSLAVDSNHAGEIWAADNNLTDVQISGTATGVNFSRNQLTYLDLSQLVAPNISYSNNPLIGLNIKNGYDDTTGAFYILPSIRYICADEMEVAAVQEIIDALENYTTVNTYCTFNPGGSFYTINGGATFDSENNGCDPSDLKIKGAKFTISNNATIGSFTADENGFYTNTVLEGSHVITPVFENPSWFSASPTSAIVTFPADASPALQNFCITGVGAHDDLEVIILPLGIAKPGFDADYRVIYRNKGTTTLSGTLGFTFPETTEFVSANPIAAVTNHIANWSFTGLLPFETREANIRLNVHTPTEIPAVNDGDQLALTANLLFVGTDETPDDNAFTLNQTALNAMDPNDKTCLEGMKVNPNMAGKYVHYKIRFENTGTANAQHVVVKDLIDTTKFDVSSLVTLSSSHAVKTKISEDKKVEFIFQNINLPFNDANNDGYVLFKIKTRPELVAGDSFSNSASIYFDYNFPVITNTATTTLSFLALSDFEFADYFTLYPNPAGDVLNIQPKKQTAVSSVSIYNALGQLVLVNTNFQYSKTIDVSGLKTGNYFIKINSDQGTTNAKFIKK